MDWATVSALATAGGTLVLAAATFASVRSANRAARTAERALQAGIRPLLMTSRPQDDVQKVHFSDGKWLQLPGGGVEVDVDGDRLYLGLSLRNVGSGLAIIHGWLLHTELDPGAGGPPDPESFRRVNRDLYIGVADNGFWQGALRDPDEPGYRPARAAITGRMPMMVDLLYGDHEGGQRAITRFVLYPMDSGGWRPSTARHWNLDRPDPR